MIDLVASWPHYEAHLLPVWNALPAPLRGRRGAQIGAQHRTALIAAHRDLVLARRREYGRVIYLEHGIGQSYAGDLVTTGAGFPGYPGGASRDHVGLFLSPNATAAAMDRRAYPEATVIEVGDPRLDTLPGRIPSGIQRVAVTFHWDSSRVNAFEGRPATDHYEGVLAELARSVEVIGHAHPRAVFQLRKLFTRMGIPFVESFDEVCRLADLLVADNTSCLYEFASTGRPVVVLNAPWYRRDIEHGLRFWAASRVGPNVEDPADLVETVHFALTDPPEQLAAREAALDIAYAHRSGAGPRAAAAIIDWLRSRGEVAA